MSCGEKIEMEYILCFVLNFLKTLTSRSHFHFFFFFLEEGDINRGKNTYLPVFNKGGFWSL